MHEDSPNPSERVATRRPIHSIQGAGLFSPFAGELVRTRGVVTGHSRKGFFIQDPRGEDDPEVSDAIFVFSPRDKASIGALVEVEGEVVDYAPGENERPTTQIKRFDTEVLREDGPTIDPVWLTTDQLPADIVELAAHLNGLEGMLVGIEAGATFVAPSNPFGDYVVAPRGIDAPRAPNGGILIERDNPERWFPGFRIVDYAKAPRLDVGSELKSPVVGPLNYRASSFQIAAQGPIDVESTRTRLDVTAFEPNPEWTTVMTLNGFNLDGQLEDAALVQDPRYDIDDDVADGRFEQLAQAVVEQAGSPDLIVMQEIQDNDGAEITATVSASGSYALMIREIGRAGGPKYRWADIPPESEADGGQPGGNIRNAYLYNPERVELVDGSLRRLGDNDPAFEGSRKPLLARFQVKQSGAQLVVVNVHLASKRHQNSLFAPERPGHDPRESTRIRQAEVVHAAIVEANREGFDYYVAGDFNDFEFSDTLRTLKGDESANLVESVPFEQRYDYNHRGKLQVLMHGIVSKRQLEAHDAEYEILHGNELIGVQPGELGGKATDHAYVLARLRVAGRR